MTDPTSSTEVLAANAAFYAAFESGDLDAMHDAWVSDGPICVHPGWTPVVGNAAVRRSWAVVMANTPYIQFFLTDVDVRVTADVAVLTCVENILTGLPGGEEPGEEPLGFAGGKVVTTNVFRRTRAGWRMWLHHASPVLADEEDEDADHDEEAR